MRLRELVDSDLAVEDYVGIFMLGYDCDFLAAVAGQFHTYMLSGS